MFITSIHLVKDGSRNKLKTYLQNLNSKYDLLSIPIHKQKPYFSNQLLKNTDILSEEVISPYTY